MLQGPRVYQVGALRREIAPLVNGTPQTISVTLGEQSAS
jgi:hypothetical protein